MKVAAIIPARFSSTRLPGKPLKKIDGKEMVLHVCERAREANSFDAILVATDNRAIQKIVKNSDFEVLYSEEEFKSGSDRCAWASTFLSNDYGFVVNLQGDEPLIPGDDLCRLVEQLKKGDEKLVTLIAPIRNVTDYHDPNVVKAVASTTGYALYFSRSPIPFCMGKKEGEGGLYRHIGVYGFQREFLINFQRLPWTPLALIENLEQLRALENRFSIKVVIVEQASPGVDTQADLEKIRRIWPKSFSH
ncbi:3-deoxy-manno-octulosonate cytidylyltransferase [Candidatus Riflebacteria bacterium]